MSRFLFVESRDPFEFADVVQTWNLALDLGREGHEVTFFLVQNAVLAARAGARTETLNAPMTIGAGAPRIYADELSLRERAIESGSLRPGVSAAPMETLVDLLLVPGTRAVWT